MGSDANRLRKKWQDYGGNNAGHAERSFHETFTTLFEGTEYTVRPQPNEFSKIYVNVPLSENVLAEIYTPDIEITRHGVFPEGAIQNVANGNIIILCQ